MDVRTPQFGSSSQSTDAHGSRSGSPANRNSIQSSSTSDRWQRSPSVRLDGGMGLPGLGLGESACLRQAGLAWVVEILHRAC